MSAEGLDTFVPLMKVSKGFDELKKVVIDQGICSGCSTCVAFCERIKLDEDGNAAEAAECTIKQGSISCSDDGTCYDVCPMVSHSKPELDEDTFGTKREDMDLGVYKRVIAVRSTKPEILGKAQDGGAATAFLAAGLEGGIFDGAVFAERDDDWSTEAGLATKPEEVMAGGGTKYARTPTTMRWGQTIRNTKRLAMVGTGWPAGP
jgi:coenzyme F420 hydrogenase subunit beta